jgi:hypothetical protein
MWATLIAFERALGRSGGDIMVHGTCSSRGCFAMTNDQIEEIYAVMREAFNGGQKGVQFQSYPFRMTTENLAKFRYDPNMAFWKNLKQGSDHFEVTKREPRVAWCGNRYVFNATAENGRMEPTEACPTLKTDPEIAQAVAEKARQDDVKVAELVQKGTTAIRVQYADGSQHMSFRSGHHYAANATDERFGVVQRGMRTAALGEISRPEAIDGAQEIPIDETGKPKAAPVVAQVESTPAKPVAGAGAAGSARSYAEAPATAVPAAEVPAAEVPAAKPAGAFTALSSLFTVTPGATGSIEPTVPANASAPPQPSSSQAVSAPVKPPAPEAAQAAAIPAAPAGSVVNKTKSGSEPFYKRWLGFGAKDPDPSESDGALPAAQSAPAEIPLPPKRADQATAPQKQSAAPALNPAKVAALPVSSDAPGALNATPIACCVSTETKHAGNGCGARAFSQTLVSAFSQHSPGSLEAGRASGLVCRQDGESRALAGSDM